MLTEVLARLRRYWPVTLIGIMVSIGLSVWVVFALPARYDSSRSLLFVPSPTSEDPERPLNPFYSYLTDSLATAITIISIIVSDDRVADRVAPEGSGIDYWVSPDVTIGAPVLVIEVTAPTPEAADDVADEVSALVAETLASQQKAAGGPESTWITATEISSSLEPERNWRKAVQLAAVSMALGLIATVTLVAMLSKRSRRRPRSQPQDHARDEEPGQSMGIASFSESGMGDLLDDPSAVP